MRVQVLGAGIIGLFCADELSRRGHQVTVVDPAPASGASFAAAGMLSPAAEVWYGEEELLAFGARSVRLWPEAADRLGVRLRRRGTLLVGRDADDCRQVERQVRLLESLGAGVQVLDRSDLLAREPALGPRVVGGAWLPDEASVDPRSVLAALLDRVPVLAASAAPYDVQVVATGARLPAPFAGLVRGVRGEILRASGPDLPRVTVRGWVFGDPVYVVPRGGGEVVVGATSEEHDGDPVVTLGGVQRLLTAARELVPALDRASFVEAVARDRPGTRDNLPLVGPSGVDGVLLAAGHYRHGVLLAPLTASLIADHLESGYVEPALDPRRCAPERTSLR